MTLLRYIAIPMLVLTALLAPAAPAQATDHTPGLDAMIGQMLLIGFHGAAPEGKAARRITRLIANGQIGGVILMDRNIRSPRQLRALTSKFLNTGHPLTPIISVDQEGGLVQRLSANKGFRRYPTARTMARRYTPEKARRVYKAMARELARAGVNLNYGPVVDLNLNRRNPIIARLGRSYGADPERVAAYARAFISAHREANVLTSVKHFPGHGSSLTDSHKRLVDLTRTWKDAELEPYRALARDGAIDTIMVGHLYLPAFSGGQRLPATLAPQAIEGWIRHKLGFNGVVITDDLEMGAIRKYHNLRTALIKAVQGGNDILMFSTSGSDPKFVPKAIRILRNAVLAGTIPRKRIEQTYARINDVKQRLRARAALRADAAKGAPP
ncbi:MAG: glycoside hydrolase family 3 protein [Methyloligellaceae bacterium]